MSQKVETKRIDPVNNYPELFLDQTFTNLPPLRYLGLKSLNHKINLIKDASFDPGKMYGKRMYTSFYSKYKTK